MNYYKQMKGYWEQRFNKEDEFGRFKLIETGLMEEEEEHGEGTHVHTLRYIFAQKLGNSDC